LPFRRFSWGWTNPCVSYLLSPDGRVRTMIGSRPDLPYLPYDPLRPETLPRSRRFDISEYLRALHEQGGAGRGRG
jgi:hypothetical protein